jgi:hypothetical protein
MMTKRTPRAALLIAHPGHELRIHGWVEAARPLVFITTDGSGATGVARISKSADVLRAAGCRRGSAFGRFTDVNVYDFILQGDVEPLVSMTREIAMSLADAEVEYAVGDAVEFYNPVHDLSRVILSLAIEYVRQLTQREIRQIEFAVVHPPQGRAASDVVVNLDEAALRRKIDAALRYDELHGQAEEDIRRNGLDAFRTERLHLLDRAAARPEPSGIPYYEKRGEEQVRAGRYVEVLRYRPHFAAFVEEMSTVFRAGDQHQATSLA